jgi:anti-sigma factor RsiW
MTECRQIESLLPPYVDGEAAASVVSQVEAHLAVCDACAASVQAQRTMRTVLRARAAQLTGQAPPGLATRITAALRPAARPSLGWAGRLSAFGAAAVLLMALVIGFEFMSPRSGVLFAAQLAIDHVRCFVLTVGTLDSGGAQAVQQEYADRYGWNVPVPDANTDLDLTLVGARRCPFSLGDHAHLRYRRGPHNVSLYVTPGEVRPAEQLRVLGHAEHIWSAGGNTYTLVARGLSGAELTRLTDYFESQTGSAR